MCSCVVVVAPWLILYEKRRRLIFFCLTPALIFLRSLSSTRLLLTSTSIDHTWMVELWRGEEGGPVDTSPKADSRMATFLALERYSCISLFSTRVPLLSSVRPLRPRVETAVQHRTNQRVQNKIPHHRDSPGAAVTSLLLSVLLSLVPPPLCPLSAGFPRPPRPPTQDNVGSVPIQRRARRQKPRRHLDMEDGDTRDE